MGAACCGICCSSADSQNEGYTAKLSQEELAERRNLQASAAEGRSKDFKQGGGGEKLKAKSKALEEAERKNKELGGPNALQWKV